MFLFDILSLQSMTPRRLLTFIFVGVMIIALSHIEKATPGAGISATIVLAEFLQHTIINNIKVIPEGPEQIHFSRQHTEGIFLYSSEPYITKNMATVMYDEETQRHYINTHEGVLSSKTMVLSFRRTDRKKGVISAVKTEVILIVPVHYLFKTQLLIQRSKII